MMKAINWLKSLSKRSKIILSVLSVILIALVLLFAIMGYFVTSIRQEITSEVSIVNPTGTAGVAFVAYRPGVSSFQKDVTFAFINGLAANNWKIFVTTTSSQTPTNLTGYDLLVLGSPTYGSKPHSSVTDYISRLDNLQGKNVSLIVTAGGSIAVPPILSTAISAINGTVIYSLLLFNFSDNGGTPSDIAYDAGFSIKPPH